MLLTSNITVVSFEEQHLVASKQILDQVFGQDYLSEADLQFYLQGDSLGLVAMADNEVIGISLVQVGTAAQIAQQLLVGGEWLAKAFAVHPTVALRKHLAIKSNWQGRGIGRMLVKDGMKILEDYAKAIISVVWQESAGKSLGRILQSCGSKPIKTIQNYWAADSLEKKYDCPACHQPPCRCSATIFARIIE